MQHTIIETTTTFKGLKRKPLKRKALKRPVAKKKKRIYLWGQFGLKRPAYVRYSGLGGVLWWLMSQYVRQDEFKRYGGRCVDGCGWVAETWDDNTDCGHFRSATSLSTRFLRENLALQRKYCNSPNGGNGRQYDFGLEIDRRYGKGTADRLTELARGTSAPFSKSWYHKEILRIQDLLQNI